MEMLFPPAIGWHGSRLLGTVEMLLHQLGGTAAVCWPILLSQSRGERPPGLSMPAPLRAARPTKHLRYRTYLLQQTLLRNQKEGGTSSELTLFPPSANLRRHLDALVLILLSSAGFGFRMVHAGTAARRTFALLPFA